MEKGSKATRDQNIRKFKPEDDIAKTRCSSLGFQMSDFFSKIDRVRLGFEI
jgi:hypothetical protein